MVQLKSIGYGPLRTAGKRRATNLERLSTGRRLNRSADGAAELAISEKMKLEITGLGQAQENVRDAISLIRTAEGALDEVQDMLKRMVTLSDQSANGTYDDALDRVSLQREVEQLKEEINRISVSANFNGIFPLKGEIGSADEKPDTPSITAEELEAMFHSNTTVLEGREAKAEQVAKWSGSITNIGEHSTLKIQCGSESKTFEFVKSGNSTIKSDNIAVELASSGEVDTDKLKNAIGTAFADKMKEAMVSISNGTLSLDLEQAEGTAKDKDKIIVESAGYAAAEEITGETTVDAKVDGNGCYCIEISNISKDSIKEGTIFNIFGIKFELDTDNNVSDGCEKITVTDLSKQTQLNSAFDSAISSKIKNVSDVFFLDSGDGHFEFYIEINDTKIEPAAGITRSNPRLSPTFSIDRVGAETKCTATKDTEGVAKVEEQKASFTETVDFSYLEVGDTITIGDDVYELTAGDPPKGQQNKAVDISAITQKSDIAEKLKEAITANSSSKYDMTISNTDANKAQITITAKTITAGETISVKYASAKLEAQKAEIEEKPDTPDIPENDKRHIRFQVGASSSETMQVELRSMTTEALEIEEVNVASQESAAASVDLLLKAVNQVSDYRGSFGAVQNRLEHTLNHLGVSLENLTQAESVIADTDMAKEVTDFTKNQILSQSAQGMWAQSMNLMRERVQQLISP